MNEPPERKCVYVVGAGFSKGLGYPLTSELLLQLWNRIEDAPQLKEDLTRIIRFHHPRFNCCKPSSFPNVEELLSEMMTNELLYHSSRRFKGKFKMKDLEGIQRKFLLKVSEWFHVISRDVRSSKPAVPWLEAFCDRVRREKAVIISFNWDLTLDELLFGSNLDKSNYGFSKESHDGPVLLKPHGSLNWFENNLGRFLKDDMKILLFERSNKATKKVYAFREFRAPVSEYKRDYTPLIIPPVYLKKFDNPIFREIWRNCTSYLSTAKRVFFLGYSLPTADYHARFIMRCGFHNQIEGELDKGNRRKDPTGPAEVIIVNPDSEASQRIKEMVNPANKCRWFPTQIADADLRWNLHSLGLYADS